MDIQLIHYNNDLSRNSIQIYISLFSLSVIPFFHNFFHIYYPMQTVEQLKRNKKYNGYNNGEYYFIYITHIVVRLDTFERWCTWLYTRVYTYIRHSGEATWNWKLAWVDSYRPDRSKFTWALSLAIGPRKYHRSFVHDVENSQQTRAKTAFRISIVPRYMHTHTYLYIYIWCTIFHRNSIGRL